MLLLTGTAREDDTLFSMHVSYHAINSYFKILVKIAHMLYKAVMSKTYRGPEVSILTSL